MEKIFRPVAGDGIRGLRSTKDVPEDAAEEEETAMTAQQNLTATQEEEEPGQYGRLLRLYAGTFRGFNTIEEQSREKGIDVGKGEMAKEKVQHDKQDVAPDWLAAISGWAPIGQRRHRALSHPKESIQSVVFILTFSHSLLIFKDWED